MAYNEIHLYQWRHLDEVTGRPKITRFRMTVDQAQQWDAAATLVEGSLEVRRVSDDPNAQCTSAWLTESGL